MLTEYEQAIHESRKLVQGTQWIPFLERIGSAGLLGGLDDDGLLPEWTMLEFRPPFLRRFAYGIPNESALREIAKHGPILEVGAGSGYWSYELTKLGGDVIATDPFPIGQPGNLYKFDKQWLPVVKMGGVDAVSAYPDRTPCYDKPWAADVLNAYQGKIVIYVGEGWGGCTADDRFYDLLERRFTERTAMDIPRWFGTHDYLRVCERKQYLLPCHEPEVAD